MKKSVIRGWVWVGVGVSGVVLQSLRETRRKCVLWAERTYPGPARDHGGPVRVEVRVKGARVGGRGKAGRA